MTHDQDVVEQFTAQVDRFLTSPHVKAQEPVAHFIAAVGPQKHERALDVACGPGLLVKAFAPHLREAVGIDLTPAMVEAAQRVAAEAGLANTRFHVGDALRLPFADREFDVVLTRLALHHIGDPHGALREMARVTGGRLGIFDMIASENSEEREYHNRVERLRDPSHARALALSELVAAVGQAGLEVERIEMLDFEQELEDWIARAEQSADDAAEARVLMHGAVGTRKLSGRRVRHDDDGRLYFSVRWAIVIAVPAG